jgi:hypothetical protein
MFSAEIVKTLMRRVVAVAVMVFCCSLAFQGAPVDAAVHSDFNGDGYDDLAVGVPGEDIGGIEDAGAVHIFYGSANAVPATEQVWHLNSADVPLAAEQSDRFGSSVAAGDFNNDGYDDLAIGIPNKDDGSGQVLVLYGAAAGLSAKGSQIWSQDNLADEPESDDRFGAALAAGDFDADGFADLVIGVPGEDFPDIGPPTVDPPMSVCTNGICLNAGIVNLVWGSASGLTVTGNELWHQDLGISYDGWVEWQDYFGSSLTVGDFDGNGADDLAVGTPGEHTGGGSITGRSQGAVSVYYGTRGVGLTGEGAEYLRQWEGEHGVVGTAQGDDVLGYAVAAGDFNGDGFDDLAAGVPGEGKDIVGGGEDAGAVIIFYGSKGGGLSASSASQSQLLSRNMMGLGSDSAGARWGTAVAAGDYNDDGFFDLAVAAPLDSVDGAVQAGSVSILFGRASRFAASGNQLLSQNTPGIKDAAHPYDWFGQTLTAVDFNGDGVSDVAVGVPFEDVGGIISSGAVNLLLGKQGSGISAANNQYLTQNSLASEDAVEAGDQFSGRAVPRYYHNPWPNEPPAGGGNHPPVLNPIGAKTAEVGQPLTLTITASDADGPAPLSLSATNLPSGANFEDFGGGSGEFSWTPPARAISNSPYSVTFTAAEDGGAGLSVSEEALITVVTQMPTVSTPTIDPNGGTFADPVEVTLQTTTEGALIYYTTDGSIPTIGSINYSAPFTLTTSATINVLAVADGYHDSEIASADFTISGGGPGSTLAKPTISPNGGTFSDSVKVNLQAATAGATIYYTTDGKTPTKTSAKYTAPFTLTTNATVKAFAAANDYDDSEVASAKFTKSSGSGDGGGGGGGGGCFISTAGF